MQLTIRSGQPRRGRPRCGRPRMSCTRPKTMYSGRSNDLRPWSRPHEGSLASVISILSTHACTRQVGYLVQPPGKSHVQNIALCQRLGQGVRGWAGLDEVDRRVADGSFGKLLDRQLDRLL